MGDRPTVSAFVITHNEEANIAECLESVSWADEIVVVDSLSDDHTVEIARQYTERIIPREFAGYTDQTLYAFEQTTGEWVLWLDADERLTPQAQQQIQERLGRSVGPGCDAFAFPRLTWLLGRWVKHSGWYPQPKVRLMRRAVSTIGGDKLVPRAVVDGKVVRLTGEILHYSYPGGIADMAQRSIKYACIAAEARYEAGRRFSLFRLLTNPPLTFLGRYILRLGFLDGLAGLTIAASAGYYRFVRELKLWEFCRASLRREREG
jgi:glycosyltransferase involved in cell wall biosynthesis